MLEKINMNNETLAFAQHCMTQLLSITPEGSEMSEISGENLSRIYKILKPYRKGVSRTLDLEKKYYIDMGLRCYGVGKYIGYDGEYFKFRISKNHWVCCEKLDGVYEKKQKNMKFVQASCEKCKCKETERLGSGEQCQKCGKQF